ncbi:hypothetical protein WR25_24659 [Diploscapter pachys]|uniref:Uncharacterized protein n=1 Tax=Diploscapter pachys TaxID=2018661 RepID=A0A2A2KAA9_9BILA|nr:hypothetical protein WR25_24659 [Diploscapter pachys]
MNSGVMPLMKGSSGAASCSGFIGIAAGASTATTEGRPAPKLPCTRVTTWPSCTARPSKIRAPLGSMQLMLPGHLAARQVAVLTHLQQPLHAVMPVAKIALRLLQQTLQLLAGMLELRVGLVPIANALDQQAQTMPIMGRIIQRLGQLAPLLLQALVDAPTHALHQAFAVGSTQEQREGVEDRQYPSKLGTGRDAGKGPCPSLLAALAGPHMTAPDQLRGQHFAVTQRSCSASLSVSAARRSRQASIPTWRARTLETTWSIMLGM